MYLWGSFGIFGLFFWGVLFRSVFAGLRDDNDFLRSIAVSGLLLLIISLTTDVWESTFALIVLGINLASYMDRKGHKNLFYTPYREIYDSK